MNKNKKYYLAKTKATVNTFIGGVSATINTPALVASKLGISASRIKAFSIIGDNIQFAVTGGSYSIPNNAFASNTDITYYDDIEGNCTSLGQNCFDSSSLNWCNFPAVATMRRYTFRNVNFTSDVSFPSWNVANTTDGSLVGYFYGAKFTNFYAPAMVNIGQLNVFQTAQVTGELVLENLATIGTSVSTSNNVFANLTGGGTLKVPAALATVNSGSPDPDITPAFMGSSVSLVYI